MRPNQTVWVVLALLLLPAASLAQADALAVVNDLRDEGCGRAPPAAPLTRSSRLDQVAELFSQGSALGDALQRGGYVATQAAAIQIESRYLGDDAIFEMLSERFCSRVADPQLREAGFVQRDDRLWLVVGEPSGTSDTPSRPAMPRDRDRDGDGESDDGAGDVIALINDARARPRRCGSQQYVAVPPLRYSAQLSDASRAHAEDMAERSYFAHNTPDGVTPAQRLARTGYQWNLTGENIARGQMSAEEAVAGWLASPGHCANIMEPRFSETGFALAAESGREGALYWVQTFAAPR
jgi:uncharacterized protein YkwD